MPDAAGIETDEVVVLAHLVDARLRAQPEAQFETALTRPPGVQQQGTEAIVARSPIPHQGEFNSLVHLGLGPVEGCLDHRTLESRDVGAPRFELRDLLVFEAIAIVARLPLDGLGVHSGERLGLPRALRVCARGCCRTPTQQKRSGRQHHEPRGEPASAAAHQPFTYPHASLPQSFHTVFTPSVNNCT